MPRSRGTPWDDVNLRAQALLGQLLLPHLEQRAEAGAGPVLSAISARYSPLSDLKRAEITALAPRSV